MKVCHECGNGKDSKEFYFIDGGLGFTDERSVICKDCTHKRNLTLSRNKYYDDQIRAQYYGALKHRQGLSRNRVARLIDNGITYNSNYYGINNFLHLLGENGSPNTSRQQQRIFNEHKSADNVIYPGELPDSQMREGACKTVTVNAYERNVGARHACIAHYGPDCMVCGINFEKVYGEIGRDFIHVHHLAPIHEATGEYTVDPIRDLRPVCPNCHAMIHKKNPPYSLEEISAFRRMQATE